MKNSEHMPHINAAIEKTIPTEWFWLSDLLNIWPK